MFNMLLLVRHILINKDKLVLHSPGPSWDFTEFVVPDRNETELRSTNLLLFIGTCYYLTEGCPKRIIYSNTFTKHSNDFCLAGQLHPP